MAKKIVANNVLQKFKGVQYVAVINDHIPQEEIEIDAENISIDYFIKIIHQLADQYLLVFTFYVPDGYSHNELPEILAIATGTKKSNFAEARAILKDKIDACLAMKIKASAK